MPHIILGTRFIVAVETLKSSQSIGKILRYTICTASCACSDIYAGINKGPPKII